MTLPVLPDAEIRVTLGVDTHAEVHVAVALDQLGRRLGVRSVPATPTGSAQLLAWASHLGPVQAAGIEGTGSWGVGLARSLRAQGVAVIEVNRPSRHSRRRAGKSDPVDAEAAARAVQAGTASAQAKTADGQVEMLRTLRLTRRSAVKARTQAANQLQSLVVTAPDQLRQQLRGLSLVQAAARLRPDPKPATLLAASKLALRSVAVRYQQLSTEIAMLDGQLDRLVKLAAPALLAVPGVAPTPRSRCWSPPATILSGCTARRPLPTCAGWRRSRPPPARSPAIGCTAAANRDANRALWVITMGRMRWDARTRAYVTRRTAEGKSKPEIIRCLKRFIARELYQLLADPPAHRQHPPTGQASHDTLPLTV